MKDEPGQSAEQQGAQIHILLRTFASWSAQKTTKTLKWGRKDNTKADGNEDSRPSFNRTEGGPRIKKTHKKFTLTRAFKVREAGTESDISERPQKISATGKVWLDVSSWASINSFMWRKERHSTHLL